MHLVFLQTHRLQCMHLLSHNANIEYNLLVNPGVIQLPKQCYIYDMGFFHKCTNGMSTTIQRLRTRTFAVHLKKC